MSAWDSAVCIVLPIIVLLAVFVCWLYRVSP